MSASRVSHGGQAAGDDLADERLACDDPDEPLRVADEDGPHLRPRQQLARLLRGRVDAERARLRDHGVPRSHG